MAEGGTVLVLDSEEAVLKALSGLLSGEVAAEGLEFDLSDTSWAAVEFKFDGEPYHATIPTSTMKGIVEFQAALHRSAALVLRDRAEIRALSSEEVADFELIFTVGEGSSELMAAAADFVKKLGDRALDAAGSKEVKIAALVVFLLFTTGSGAWMYKDYALESQKIEQSVKQVEADARTKAEHDVTIRQLSADSVERDRLAIERERLLAAERERLLAEASKQVDKVERLRSESEGGYDAVVRNSGKAEYVILQGVRLSKEDISDIKRKTRRKAEKLLLKDEAFRIEGVDPTDPKSFVVRLRRLKNNEIIVAKLDDAVSMDRFKVVIQRGEWNRSPIIATVSGRRIGEEVREAKILKAHTPRAPRKKS
jgi:hypothetical protein